MATDCMLEEGLLGDAGNLARQGLRGLCGAGQRGRGGFELHGRGRDVGDDGADRGLEIIGEADQLGDGGQRSPPCSGLRWPRHRARLWPPPEP